MTTASPVALIGSGTPRGERRPRLLEWLTVAAYVAYLVPTILHHEPWADEAQAWQLARSVSVRELFTTYLHYEGSPGLWHLLLAVLTRMHVSYLGLHWITGGIATLSIALLVFRSPFPLWVRTTLPFTFFLAFQYAVVARSYVLVPLLVFAVAAVWRRSTIIVAVLLGLLGNLALHALAVSGGLALLYAVEWRRCILRPTRREMIWSAFILGAFYAFSLWTVFPRPPDLSFPHGRIAAPIFVLIFGSISCIRFVLTAFCKPPLYAIPLVTAFVLRARQTVGWAYLLPLAPLTALAALYETFYHMGLVIPTAIATWWIAWRRTPPSRLGRASIIALFCGISLQIVWTVHAAVVHRTHPYSPDPAAAKYLAPHVAAGEAMAVVQLSRATTDAFHSIGLAPYFDHPIFVNQPRPFWWWSAKEHTRQQYLQALAQRPQIVVVLSASSEFKPERDLAGPEVQLLVSSGYRYTHLFCGERPEGLAVPEKICEIVFERQ